MRWNEDSFDTMDIYRLLFEQQDQNNLPSYPVNQLSEQARAKYGLTASVAFQEIDYGFVSQRIVFICRLLLDEAYFSTKKEEADIEWYIQINNDLTILELLEAYTRELASKWSYTWPVKLADIFLEIFEILM